MAFNYSKGPQVIGDLKAADDAQRDTKIDFGEDYIGLETSGAVRMVITGSDGKVGIGTASPNYKLDIQGDIRVRGNDIRDSSGDKAISFDGFANTTLNGSLTISGSVRNYTFPTTDGTANQVLQTNGSGVLTFVDVDDGGGGEGGGPQTPEVLKVGISSDFNITGGTSDPYQTLLLDNVEFDTFTGGAGWNTGTYNFVAKEAGYYEFQASFVFDFIQSDITQYQIYLVSSGSGTTFSQAGVPFIALNQYNNNPAQIDMRTFHLSTIANFSVNQSASIQVRQIDGTPNQTKIKGGINQTFLTIKKL